MAGEEDKEFEILDGVVLRGANAEFIARAAWSKPKAKKVQPTQNLDLCKNSSEHEYDYVGRKMINGFWSIRYRCTKCGKRLST